MSKDTESCVPKVRDFSSQRLIGLGRICSTSEDCKNVWADAHEPMTRLAQAQSPYYALCRCAAGAEPGAFEYVAAIPVSDDIPVPEGMIEIILPAGHYAEFPVAGLGDIGRAWGYSGEWLAAHPEWHGFCDHNPHRCGCVDHPAFEFYPPGFDGNGGLFIRVPLQPSLMKGNP